MVWSGEPLPAGTDTMLRDRLGELRQSGELQTDQLLLRFHFSGSKPFIIAWRVLARPENGRPAVVGLIADPALANEIFARIAKRSQLLPPSLAGDTHDLVSVRVLSPEGHEIFSSSNVWSQYMNETSLDHNLGDLKIVVALTGPAADRLVIGGLPRNRVPLLIVLLVITTGLIALTFVQLQRERELVRLRADFISGVSHELRTPLAQIRMFSETLLLDRVRSPEERRRSVEIIVNESQRLSRLIENVLQFARIERGGATLTTRPERLDLLLHDIVNGFEPLARSRRATIAQQIDDDVVATVDAGALRQIILNLLDNALKYGPPEQTISVTCRDERKIAVIAVEDQGPGISSAEASRIWEPFYRAAQDRSASGGAGIGLSIVKRLAEMHGGRVRVERGARGARFVVELPQATGDRAADVVGAAAGA